MSLTRRFLASKGIEADVIEEIITAHTDTVNALKDKLDEADKYKAKADKYEETKKELDDLRADVAKNSDKDYDALKKEFDDYKADVANKETRTAKEAAYKEVLKDAGIPEKHFAKILKYSDVDGVELDEKGKIKDSKELLKSIKDEWGDHVETQGKQGTNTPNPPSGAGGGSGRTKEDIMKIKDRAERQRAIADNPQIFGIGGE